MAELSASKNAALNACLNELTDPDIALIANPKAATVVLPDPKNSSTASEYAKVCAAGGSEPNSGAVRKVELSDRYTKHLEPKIGFVERLVLFWANHFSMYQSKDAIVRSTMGHFERNVVRKNVLNSFKAMLGGAIRHPAMLDYLDNINNTRKTPNENLAREILELYTIGTGDRPDLPNFTQADVATLTKISAGWGIVRNKNEDPTKNQHGQFVIDLKNAYPAGTFELLNVPFDGDPDTRGKKVLDWLAWQPATARHLARKLLVHFVKDDPESDLIDRLAPAFNNPNASLRTVAETLLKIEEAWAEPLTRIRPPHLWFVSQARALGFTADDFAPPRMDGAAVHYWLLRPLNHWQWNFPTPDGFPDRNDDWLYPNAMRLRLDFANQAMLDHLQVRRTPLPDADELQADLMIRQPRFTPDRKLNADLKNRQKLANLFLSPQFMCR